MDTDVVIDVLFSERSDKPGLNTFKHLLYGFEETELKTPRNLSYPIAIHCSFSSPESPEANINDEHQHLPSTMVFSLRHLVPDVKMEITPIHPLLLVPSALSTSLLVESEEAPDQVSYGYVTIDQSRHILPLTATDKDVEALPLIGIWIKNVGNPKSSMVYSLCCQFISNSKLNRLDTGKSIMLLVLVPPNRTKALPHFYEVFYYESEYRFSLFGDGPRRSDTIGDGSQDT
ncbi:hypothetical protein BC829DRAFT_258138 [Chytridium lagenaria]|nr:hypothetical protein BC829DRAFT_258138 [Chytridium lagenaria]